MGRKPRSRPWTSQPTGRVAQPFSILLSSPSGCLNCSAFQSSTPPFPSKSLYYLISFFHSTYSVVKLYYLFTRFFFPPVFLPLEFKLLKGQTFVYFNPYNSHHRTDNIPYLIAEHIEVTWFMSGRMRIQGQLCLIVKSLHSESLP